MNVGSVIRNGWPTGILVFACTLLVVSLFCVDNPDTLVGILADFLAGVIGIFLGSYFIQKRVNREMHSREMMKWLVERVDELERDACEYWVSTGDDSGRMDILAQKIKAAFPVITSAFGKYPELKKDKECLFDLWHAATGDCFEEGQIDQEKRKPALQKITSSSSRLKAAIIERM